MSLSQLKALRRAGRRPATVTVVIGKLPRWFEDGPSTVTVDRPAVDLSPLVGLSAHIVDLQPDADLTLAVIEQMQALKVTLLGGCSSSGAVGVSHEHEYAMTRYRELLCTA